MGDLERIIKEGDRRESLTALRDFLAHELDGHRCKSCMMSQLRTGDTAALVLRLQKVMDEIEALPEEGDQLSKLDELNARRMAKSKEGPKNGPRLQGGRHPKGNREAT